MVTMSRAATASAWPQPGYDAGHSYCNSHKSIVNAGTVQTLRRPWLAELIPSRSNLSVQGADPSAHGE
ncbi:hypothetical protein [Streptomyces sp. NPDC059455]|uniref:hypothetical protein n=1 Tax=Streptomyces sp. NPDC059455 TaxID=3346837 RepID=UPI0036BA9C4B